MKKVAKDDLRPPATARALNIMSERDLFGRIVASLHEATIDDSYWPVTSALIDQACGAKGNHLLFGAGSSRKNAQVFLARFCLGGERRTDIEENYFNTYYLMDERVPRIRSLPDSQLVHVADLYTEQEKKISLAYNECLPRTHTQNSLLVRLDGPGGSRIVWNIADPIEGGGWRSAQVEMIQRILPHVRQFVNLRQALVDAEAVGLSLSRLLDNKCCGVIQLDPHGRIVETNDCAAALLREQDGLSDRGGFLTARDPSDNARLQKLLEGALPKLVGPPTGGSVTVERLSTGPRLVLHVSPVQKRQWVSGVARVAAVVLIVDPGAKEHIDPGLVEEALGLTRVESMVAVSLASGLSIHDIALSTGREESTVRWHTKHIFQKQGISRQAQLVRRVQALVGLPH